MFVIQAIGTLSIGLIVGFIINWSLMTIVFVQLSIYSIAVAVYIYINEQIIIEHRQIIEKATTVSSDL